VDTIDTGGRTALLWASSHGYLSIVELLVEGGSDIEIADDKGKKARDTARARNHTAVVEGGSDIEIADDKGKKARDTARARNHTAVVEYLRTPLKDKRWLRRADWPWCAAAFETWRTQRERR
jgi:ankyrin repeat protein